MKKTFFLVLISGMFYSQVKTELEVFNNSRGNVFEVSNTNIKSYPGIDGLPYYNETFLPISIAGYNRSLPNVRYNAYEDEMEFKTGNVLNYIVKSGELRIHFTDTSKVYVLKEYELDKQTVNGYLVEIINSSGKKFGLYKKEAFHIVENSNSTTNTYLKPKNPYFEKSKEIFLVSKGLTMVRVPKNLKEIKPWLNDLDSGINTDNVMSFIKKNKINLSKEQDIKKLIDYINI